MTQQTTRQTAKRSIPSGILVARGRLDGTDTYAIPDTGAQCNIITASFAGKLGLRVQQHEEGSNVIFAQQMGVDFYVVEDFMCDLLLGNDFLMKTKTMSHHKYRLSRIPRSTNALSVLRVNLLGLPSQRVRGTIRNWGVWALPDSGSEPNILSWEFVKNAGLESLIDWGDQRVLQFADGSLGRTEGSIRTEWTFRSKSQLSGSGIIVKFYVTRDCVYDAIIGQDMLEETDVFLSHEEDFVYVESDTRAAAMNLVIFAAKRANKSSSPPRMNDGIHAELQRRARVDAESRRTADNIARVQEEARRESTRRAHDGNALPPEAHLHPSGTVAGQSNDNRISHASDGESRSDTSSSFRLGGIELPKHATPEFRQRRDQARI
ncbi:hypothetical protein F5Y13DRAFT_193095 [Hypoxylon sp. FL1857]|nr:hypothetical protein F5Y13DRAFT_193095 [Hypoxylon sp. FL1857]